MISGPGIALLLFLVTVIHMFYVGGVGQNAPDQYDAKLNRVIWWFIGTTIFADFIGLGYVFAESFFKLPGPLALAASYATVTGFYSGVMWYYVERQVGRKLGLRGLLAILVAMASGSLSWPVCLRKFIPIITPKQPEAVQPILYPIVMEVITSPGCPKVLSTKPRPYFSTPDYKG